MTDVGVTSMSGGWGMGWGWGGGGGVGFKPITQNSRSVTSLEIVLV